MDISRLNRDTEAYLNRETDSLVLENRGEENAFDRFALRTALRLKNTTDLYRRKKCGRDDYLLALRDYLLVLRAELFLREEIPDENEFGILRDPEKGTFYASPDFPKYVKVAFADAAFHGGGHPEEREAGMQDLRTDPMIRNLTGFTHFKSAAQKLAVYGTLGAPDGYTVLVSLPTGGGKSLITQTVAYQKPGLTVIVVPTISLAIDQVRAAKGILKTTDFEKEVFYYSSGTDKGPILDAIRNRTARMLFISPESLINNPDFRESLSKANQNRYLKNLIIDEAHILVDWGTSFRVDYQCLEAWRRDLMQGNTGIRTMLLSATYEEYCVSVLKEFFSDHGEKWMEIRCDSLRHEPRFQLVRASSSGDKRRKTLELVRRLPHPMIVYVATPDDAEETVRDLKAAGLSNVRSFTGRDGNKKRRKLIDGWVKDEYEIMVATSAFGVGVDKSDVRTVLHLYVPPNPNAYYQELGRGGRDGLPSLSVLCIMTKTDTEIAFSRITKRVMTEEKIDGRWDSMYQSEKTVSYNKWVEIDTSVRPEYSGTDPFDDTPISDADTNWNIYVLLFLRRARMIRIENILKRDNAYIFVIEILEEVLREKGEARMEKIRRAREREWEYFRRNFYSMLNAIRNADRDCWSEMFFDTYGKVPAYCAGCGAHDAVEDGETDPFPLKMPVPGPLKTLGRDQEALFRGAESVIRFSPAADGAAAKWLSRQRISAFVSAGESGGEDWPEVLCEQGCTGNVLFLGMNDVKKLAEKNSMFYLSGIIAVRYRGSARQVYDALLYVRRLCGRSGIRVIHLPEENTRFPWVGKNFTDLADGAVIPVGSCKA